MVGSETFRIHLWTALLALCAANALALRSSVIVNAATINNVLVGSSLFSSQSKNCEAATNLALALALEISITEDLTCKAGGCGCYSVNYRFRLAFPTDRSSAYLPCPAPIPAPVPTTKTPGSASVSSPSPTPKQAVGFQLEVVTCDIIVAPGDLVVGVNVVADTHCPQGGIGCFQDICRYCKTRDTSQSSHWLSCADLTLLGTYDTLSTISVASGACPTVAQGDVDFGINIVTDVTYANFDVATAPAPGAAVAPIATTGNCAVSPGDAAVGISSFTDLSCTSSTPGIGCLQGTCRYCKTPSMPQSQHFASCPTPAPTTATPAPITEVPIASQLSVDTCDYTISPGDKAFGLDIITDANCANGGLGCFADVCRFCRTSLTDKFASYLSCGEVLGTATAPAAVALGDQGVGISAYEDATCKTIEGVSCFQDTYRYCKTRLIDQFKHLLNCDGTVITTPAAVTTPAVVTTSAAASAPTSSAACAQTLSSGDQGVGISAYLDVTCKTSDDVGCFFQDTCHYCKTRVMTQSKNFYNCPIPAPTTPAPTPAETATGGVLSVSEGCPAASAGDLLNSISIVSDIHCLTKSITGCIPNLGCGFYYTKLTDKSKHLESCVALLCPAASPGNTASGLNIAYDKRCASGSIGCISTCCRVCKIRTITIGDYKDYLACSSITSTSVMQVAVKMAMAAATDSAGDIARSTAETAELTPFEYTIAGVAAVDVVAVVAMLTIGAKRIVNKLLSSVGVQEVEDA